MLNLCSLCFTCCCFVSHMFGILVSKQLYIYPKSKQTPFFRLNPFSNVKNWIFLSASHIRDLSVESSTPSPNLWQLAWHCSLCRLESLFLSLPSTASFRCVMSSGHKSCGLFFFPVHLRKICTCTSVHLRKNTTGNISKRQKRVNRVLTNFKTAVAVLNVLCLSHLSPPLRVRAFGSVFTTLCSKQNQLEGEQFAPATPLFLLMKSTPVPEGKLSAVFSMETRSTCGFTRVTHPQD